MALLTITVILYTEIIVISAATLQHGGNGTYVYNNIEFVCNSNSSFTIVSLIGPTSTPAPGDTPGGAECRLCAQRRRGAAAHRCLTPRAYVLGDGASSTANAAYAGGGGGSQCVCGERLQ